MFASRCPWVFGAGLGLLGVLGGAEMMPWGSHIPEDMEGLSPPNPSHLIPFSKVLSSSWLCCPRCSSRTGIPPAPLIIRSPSPALSACLFLAALYVFIFVPTPSFQLLKAVLPLCYRPPPPAVFIRTNHISCLKPKTPKTPES